MFRRLCELTVEQTDGVVRARLVGEIDLSNADDLAGELQQRVSNQALAVIVDLTEVQYVDSRGLELLFDFRRRLGNRQQRMRLVVPEGSATARLLALVKFDQVAEIDPTLAAARAALELD